MEYKEGFGKSFYEWAFPRRKKENLINCPPPDIANHPPSLLKSIDVTLSEKLKARVEMLEDKINRLETDIESLNKRLNRLYRSHA